MPSTSCSIGNHPDIVDQTIRATEYCAVRLTIKLSRLPTIHLHLLSFILLGPWPTTRADSRGHPPTHPVLMSQNMASQSASPPPYSPKSRSRSSLRGKWSQRPPENAPSKSKKRRDQRKNKKTLPHTSHWIFKFIKFYQKAQIHLKYLLC